MIWEGEYEYFIRQLNPNCWKVYKVDGHYKEPTDTYTVMLIRGSYHCDCPAPRACKHMDMVKPKKELF
jgi:hypothetical protein